MNGSFTHDASLWPLVLLRLEGTMSDQQLDAFFAHGHATLLRRERYVSIFDLSRLTLPSPEQRQQQARWMKEHESLLREFLLGTAFVVTSPFVRMTLSLLFHLTPTPAPYVVVPSVDSGIVWAAARLDQYGLSQHAERVRRHYFPSDRTPRV